MELVLGEKFPFKMRSQDSVGCNFWFISCYMDVQYMVLISDVTRNMRIRSELSARIKLRRSYEAGGSVPNYISSFY